ncbi:MAG: UDP-N-acetylmuramyl-tripeptide synthetase [Candidatus Parcubacteria bacterium]|nr:UDP-N-acetylmuramyl-tripeptide synthetase [Candidatus Parcubacteria bacterium]
MNEKLLGSIRRLIPQSIFSTLQRPYHWIFSLAAAIWYRFPSRHIKVIAVTGTKGKSSTVEIINAILERAGYKTALSNTIRFKVGETSTRNLHKMSMPGRFVMQKLLRQAVDADCAYMVVEMTSQGALLYRHRFIALDTLVFTNLSPEHIEAHGSYEKYVLAKLSIAQNMKRSGKKTTLIINADDAEAATFLACAADRKIRYSAKDAEPYEIKTEGIEFTFGGRTMRSPLSGLFNLYNILAAATCASSENVSPEVIAEAVSSFSDIPGRVEKVDAGQNFTVVVDYAHTPDSLEKLYKVFRPDATATRSKQRLIAILGGTGGGRDSWKRAEMGRLADLYCDEVILTDEDPYDEDPNKIAADVAAGVTAHQPIILMDRRKAIRRAISLAHPDDIVLITGKGTDPYIMGPRGTKTPWSDSAIAREELEKTV